MKGLEPLRMAPQTAEEQLAPGPEALYEAWLRHESQRLSPVTLRHYRYEVKVFLDAWAPHDVTKLRARDVWAYLDAYGARCGQYATSAFPGADHPACRQGMDLAGCGQSCPGYRARGPEVVGKHLTAVVSLYDFLVGREFVEYNIVRDVKREWLRRNRHRSRKKPRRLPTTEEVEALVNQVPAVNRRTFYAVLAKTGIRLREATALQVDREHMDLEEGWMKVPFFSGKRRGNRTFIIDASLERLLREYLEWRRHRVKCLLPHLRHDKLFVTQRGTPLNPDENTVNRHFFRHDACRLGIHDGTESRQERITTHCMRHYFSNELKRSGIDPYWWNILRGDIPKGNEATYVHPSHEQIHAQYLKHAPRFKIL